MREIVLDTETTGVEALKGDRIVEIGCVELVNHCPTGRTFHVYINPERDMPDGAFRVHGLSEAFLSDKPVFAAVASEFAAFIADARLVIHNAAFDVGFINMEFGRLGLPPIVPALVVDTLAMARRKHPGASNSLDALCSRYGIDNSRRTKHGALLDSEILAEVYIELIGGKQTSLGFGSAAASKAGAGLSVAIERPVRQRSLAPRLTPEERAAHESFVMKLKGPLWRDYLGVPEEA
ncbi:DNA polymerase III subunit epsilon [Bosea sp. NPDC003192]|uniref:DNA polymerase III subunit epsilon n=1 Tax=Bosea sp. NPDC003192 TaxID=3390551 RepID=UPI003CFF0EDE